MKINNFFIIFLSAIYILHGMPTIGYRIPSIVWAVIIVVHFIFLLFNIGLKPVLKFLPIFFIPFLDIFIKGENILSYIEGFSHFLPSMIPPMLALYLYKRCSHKTVVFLFSIYFVINLITCITTYYGCQIFPEASRDLAGEDASNSNFYNVYMNANIGGFGFVYSQILHFVLAICAIRNYKDLPKGKLILTIAIVYSICIVMAVVAAEYIMAILLTLSCLLLFFISKNIKFKKILLLGVSLLFVFWAFKPLIAEGLMTVANNTESKLIAHRLTDISLSLEEKPIQDDSDLNKRSDLYQKSLNSFINNPLGEWSLNCIGGHSYILDAMGKYGVLGLILLFVLMRLIYTEYIKILRGTFIYGYALVCFLLFIIMAGVNPKAFTEFFLFVLPIYALTFTQKSKKLKINS